MTFDIKPFVKLLKQKNLKNAREWLDQNKGDIDHADEFEKGYLLALQGMISALESGGELSVIKRVVNGGYEQELIDKLVQDTRGRLSLKFRPRDEQGFDTAWIDVLQELSAEKK